jgi:hypothetical protein
MARTFTVALGPAYELAYLRSLADAKFLVDEAYGNATTDVSAFAGVRAA